MKALVTGANGFLGSFLVERLLDQGATVAAIVRPGADLWRIEPLLPRLTCLESNLREVAGLRPRVLQFAPDTVFHLGWQGVAGRHRNDPQQVDANLQGSLDLLRLSHEAGCRTWIGVGSQAEYGPTEQIVAEDTPVCPATIYGTVKLCVGLLGQRLAAELGMRFAWLRLFALYGPKDNPDWLISYVIRTLLEGKKPSLTACRQNWDYLYVADAADALCRVALADEAAGVFNLGAGKAHPLRELVERIRDLVDPALPLGFGEVEYRPDQIMHLQADIGRLCRATGWSPATSLEEGLRQTVAWHVCRLSL